LFLSNARPLFFPEVEAQLLLLQDHRQRIAQAFNQPIFELKHLRVELVEVEGAQVGSSLLGKLLGLAPEEEGEGGYEEILAKPSSGSVARTGHRSGVAGLLIGGVSFVTGWRVVGLHGGVEEGVRRWLLLSVPLHQELSL
jgi:hypothetical protein